MKKENIMTKLTFLLVLLGVFICGTCFAEEAELKLQAVCPVMGGQINKDIYMDYQSQRIYFCCPSCKGPFLKNTEKYLKKIADDGVFLESVQEKCPVLGGKIDKNVYTDYKGRRVYFCCPACIKSFEKDPEKYLKKLE
jgi:YHS domain-containing protein